MTLTAAGDIVESATLINLNVPPVLIPTAGEGGSFRVHRNEDTIATTSSAVANSTYTLGPRIPTNAKIKKVQIYTKGSDSNATATMAADINLIFSDAALGGIAAGQPVNDGTPTSLSGLIPTSALTGATTSITAYSSPNKMFGSAVTIAANSGAVKLTDITFQNTFKMEYMLLPIWDVLGWTSDPGGFFNFFVVLTTGPATAAAGTLGLIVDYAV